MRREDWLKTSDGSPRGYVQPSQSLRELWFHTGTNCNLSCPFCLEGSKPGDRRLLEPDVADIEPFLAPALKLGVEKFSFTGGEPFVNREFPAILRACLQHRPCLVLTNATRPLLNRLDELTSLLEAPHPLNFRVSIDSPDPAVHDHGRGSGNFERSFETLGRLHRLGFSISLARQSSPKEDAEAINAEYRNHLRNRGLPEDTRIVVFPDFGLPGQNAANVPEITENCMRTYQSEATRSDFMCAFSKMIVKTVAGMRVVACTLVDDDPDYDLGPDLPKAQRLRIMLKHHRCFACFSHGASCSEN